jgi:N-methylhydantoinase A/oxoprolinase/acetone carboxylase beta subunit
VDPALTFGVPERLDASGSTLLKVDHAACARIAKAIVAAGGDIAAVCLLHAYANPAHERQVAAILRRAGLAVCASSDVLPEYREYERWSTTVVNAYVTPLIDRYLGNLEKNLGGRALSIMQSNGGSISATAARAQAVRTVLSGPAAGVVGAEAVARAAGFRRIISFDMGGTSTDVSLIDHAIATTTDSRVGDFPVRLPVLDIHTVGAGGGSIAVVDAGGALRVGPQSAGADPGPVCYGKGEALTVTDANLLLGRLDPDFFLGGRMQLDASRVWRVAADLAERMGVGVPELAEGVVRVANANMERAIRVVSVERGHDPREFALLAFGGAGGMHACEIAHRLDIGTVIVPRHAGVLSALGMLLADVTKDYSASVLRRCDELSFTLLTSRFKPLIEQARADLHAEGFSGRRVALARLLDVRYVGQSYEITLPLTPSFRTEFDARHGKTYGYSNPSRAVEIVNVRVVASGLTDKPSLPQAAVKRDVTATADSVRRARFEGRQARTKFFKWERLSPGASAAGPAVIAGGEATVVIPPAFSFRIDGFGNVIATRKRSKAS